MQPKHGNHQGLVDAPNKKDQSFLWRYKKEWLMLLIRPYANQNGKGMG
jgi:hypothetical protein